MKLRMFTSHLLIAQDYLKRMLSPETMEKLRAAICDDPQPEDLEICFLLDKLVENQPVISLGAVRKSSSPSIRQHEVVKKELMDRFSQQSTSLIASNTPRSCIICTCSLTESLYFTSCMHSYCKDCYEDSQGESNLTQCECTLPIEEAIWIDKSPPATTGEGADTDDDEFEADPRNWVTAAGLLMPGAKMTAIKNLVRGWLNESADTKITIFTQFLSMVDLLSMVCADEGWGFVTV